MTKIHPQTEGRHGLLPIINNLFSKLHPRTQQGFPHFDHLDPHTEQDIGFHRDGRLHERDESRF